MIRKQVLATAFVLSLAPFTPAQGEPDVGMPTRDSRGWEFELKPYLWGAGLDGDVGIGPVQLDVDVGFGDLVDHLDIGGMLGLEAKPADADWTLLFDFLYLDLGDDLDRADADVSVLITEFDVAFRPDDWNGVELLAGLRYWDLDAELQVGPLNPRTDESWVDPVLGVRGTTGLGDDWSLRWRGDVGGFGVGADFGYQLSALFVRPLGDSTQLGVGWRHLDVDYEEDGFRYDTQTTGLLVGLSWAF